MRYGAFRYGDGTKYGEGLHDTQLWALFIDWNGAGLANQANEAAYLTNVKTVRGRTNLLNAKGTGFEPVAIGSLILELDNFDGRYHPFNSGSAIYPYVRPGVKIQVKTKLPVTGEVFDVFTGQIDDIIPLSENYEKVKISAVDGLKLLDDQDVILHTQVNQSVNANINTTLTESAWPWGVNLETSTDVIPWFWSPSGVKVRGLLDGLASSYLGMFFVDTSGAARFYTRNHSFAASKLRIEQGQVSRDINTRSPWEVVKNNITVICHPRAIQPSTVVWSLFDKPSVASGGGTFETWGSYSSNGQEVPISSYVVPVSGTDFVVNSNSDGSGTDLTASCTVTVTVFANKVKFVLTNNSGSIGHIMKMQLRGSPLAEIPANAILTDAESVGLYGLKSMTIDSVFLQNSNLIADLAGAMLTLLKDTQMYPTIKVINRPEIQYTVDLFDNIDLVLEKFGIADTYRIGYIEHGWMSENGQVTETIFGLEPVNNNLGSVWTFPTQIGISSIFAF